jgi:hypothetical protein
MSQRAAQKSKVVGKPKAKSYYHYSTIGKKSASGLLKKPKKSGGSIFEKGKYSGAVPLDSHGTVMSGMSQSVATLTMLGNPKKQSFQSSPIREINLANDLIARVESSSPDVKTLCDTYKLRREELGRLTGFSLRALAEWAAGKLPSEPAKRRLQEVRRLLDGLAEIIKADRIPGWLRQPNPAFDRLTPLQVIELGEIDRLWAMVHDLASGQPT